MEKRWLGWTLGWVAVTAAAFLLMNWVLALFVAVVGLTVLVVAMMSSNWEGHPSFDDRELDRARRRTVKRERTAGARARDRARWEAHRAGKAAGR